MEVENKSKKKEGMDLRVFVWKRVRGKQSKARQGRHAKGVEMHIQQQGPPPSLLTKATNGVFRVVRLTEFEILFVLFFAIVFLLFKDLVC